MKFLVDRCAGRRLADWLRGQGHDVLEARSLGPDPGDRELLEIAAKQERVLVTIDTDLKAPRLAGDLGSAALTSEVYPPSGGFRGSGLCCPPSSAFCPL